MICAAGVTDSHVASAPLFSKCSPTFAKKYTKESVPDPHNPRDIFLAGKNGYFLTDFGILGNIRFCPSPVKLEVDKMFYKLNLS